MITWYGHACFKVDNVLIDPFVPNPLCNLPYDEIMKGVDVIAVTHGHADHLGNAEELAKTYNVPVVTNHEISVYLSERGVNAEGMNIGGTIEINGAKLTMVKAEHSSDISPTISGGVAAGFIINDRVYHAGDTGLFGDMELIGEIYAPQIALLPIGGRYTMGIDEALVAIELIYPEIVIPMHYNTFPLIEVDVNEFVKKAEALGVEVIVPKVGEPLDL
ncbi:beta-lactamase domain protein [Methanocaldococcus sp. FS406-22]|uniref:metal-dependent hydrolase n=1 Tax=Methanocaldococcus sp. (strain FS406-22) TaxID=644281 RepID=UPI0001BF3EFD|nr:metal-dependent hydrolase [Methanocaldococcus sp. FS406-22]ADC69478.1 beta-lactamase domain protein [Methanocaldococcus sp. FS406-22]